MQKLGTTNIRDRSREIATSLKRFVIARINTGQLVPGDKIPTERQLVDMFGGGRGTVRKALLELEREGIVAREVGRGTFIKVRRLLLEPAVVEQVVSRASSAEIDVMSDCLERARVSTTLEDFEHWDDMLHRSFAAASRNPLYTAVYAMIGAVRLEAAWGELKRKTLTDELKRRHFEEHVRIVDAIRDRDASRARREMFQHLDHIRKNMFGA